MVASPARAGDFFSANILDDLKAALPGMKFVAGDPSWNGGLYTNGFVGATGLDTNSAYVVFQAGAGAPSPAELARQIGAVLFGKYHVTPDADLHGWPKSDPPGVAKADFAESYAVGRVNNARLGQVRVVLTVQVVRLAPARFGITVTYIAVGG
jgi:hypothetical protein